MWQDRETGNACVISGIRRDFSEYSGERDPISLYGQVNCTASLRFRKKNVVP
jgi:hypothetical protein